MTAYILSLETCDGNTGRPIGSEIEGTLLDAKNAAEELQWQQELLARRIAACMPASTEIANAAWPRTIGIIERDTGRLAAVLDGRTFDVYVDAAKDTAR